MISFKKTVMPIILATVWIGISEFARNEIVLKEYWTRHYEKLGIAFPSEPINGAIWGLWSLIFAIAIFNISRKFSLVQTTLLAWLFAFILMWVVIGNLGFLPYGMLFVAVPLSLLEAFIAAFIIKKTS